MLKREMIKKKINTEKWQMREEKFGRRKSLEKRKRVEFTFQVGKSCWNYPFAEGEDDGHSSYEALSRATACGGCQVAISPVRCEPCSEVLCSHSSSSHMQEAHSFTKCQVLCLSQTLIWEITFCLHTFHSSFPWRHFKA